MSGTEHDRLAGFPAFLHGNGFAAGGAGAAVDTLQVAARVGAFEREPLRHSLKALLCGRGDEWRRFDALFDAWFLPANRWQALQLRDVADEGRHAGAQAGGTAPQDDTESDHDDSRPRRTASREEVLASTDFARLTAREHLLDIEALMRRLARRLRWLRLRREQQNLRGARLDLPGTIRRSVERGGLPLELRWREHRRVRPRLVLLVDVSRSMAAYSFFYLRLARALAAEWPDVRSFVFHTRITGVSRALADPDPWRAQERLQFLAQGFAGGTRIGECLAMFNREHGPRLVHGRTAVLVMSDGYDTGEPAQLAQALVQLRRRARRVVWLNPLAAQPGYAPLSQAMAAALPHLDLFAPGADLAGIAAVLPRLVQALH